MSVARAEAELATILLIELMAAVAEEEEHQDDEPGMGGHGSVTPQSAPAA